MSRLLLLSKFVLLIRTSLSTLNSYVEVKVSQEVPSGPWLQYDWSCPRESEQKERENFYNQISLISPLRHWSDYLLNYINKLPLLSSTTDSKVQIHPNEESRVVVISCKYYINHINVNIMSHIVTSVNVMLSDIIDSSLKNKPIFFWYCVGLSYLAYFLGIFQHADWEWLF